jgi:hypothetical protein
MLKQVTKKDERPKGAVTWQKSSRLALPDKKKATGKEPMFP